MSYDHVFDREKRIVFGGVPETVYKRLRCAYPPTWEKVCVGETEQFMSIPEYLCRDRLPEVERLMRELLAKKDQAIFQKMPDRLDPHIRHTIKKIVEEILRVGEK